MLAGSLRAPGAERGPRAGASDSSSSCESGTREMRPRRCKAGLCSILLEANTNLIAAGECWGNGEVEAGIDSWLRILDAAVECVQ